MIWKSDERMFYYRTEKTHSFYFMQIISSFWILLQQKAAKGFLGGTKKKQLEEYFPTN